MKTVTLTFVINDEDLEMLSQEIENQAGRDFPLMDCWETDSNEKEIEWRKNYDQKYDHKE